MNGNSRGGDDLVWTAYQYTADELSASAARDFEAALETDQSAREALAEAVSLGDTIRAALVPEPIAASGVMPASLIAANERRAAYGWGSAVAWVALGAAACLALTMAVRNAPRDEVGQEAPVAKSDAHADQHLLAVLFPEEASDSAAMDASVAKAEAGAADASTAYASTAYASTAYDAGADTGLSSGGDETAFGPMPEPMPEASAPDWLIAAVVEADVSVNE
jgi:hypothetical protein